MTLRAKAIVGRFDSTPAGASVKIVVDGESQSLGKTPVEYELDPRREYDVVFDKRGYATTIRPLVVGDQSPIVLSVELAALENNASGRDRVRQWDDDADSDRSPRSASQVRRQRASSAGRNASATSEDSDEDGILMLGSKPPCQIFVDGQDIGKKTPQAKLQLPAGVHKITLVNESLDIEEDFSVRIRPGRTTRIIKDFVAQIESD